MKFDEWVRLNIDFYSDPLDGVKQAWNYQQDIIDKKEKDNEKLCELLEQERAYNRKIRERLYQIHDLSR